MATKNYGAKDIEAWKFEEIPLSAPWRDHLGDLTEGFRLHITGPAKNGKTEYLLQLCQELCENFGKVSFNSTEQVRTSGFQKAYRRNNLSRFGNKFSLADKSQKSFDVWFKKLCSKATGKVIVLDSTDYMRLTFEQWQQLNDKFGHKSIILVSWKGNPLIKKLEYMMDAIIEVKDFKAHIASRVGGGKKYNIWPDKHPDKATVHQGNLFTTNQN
jgi:nucleoside-triphosphatase THEP1